MPELIDVYAYRKNQNKIELLILKRAADVIYAGQWRMIGGKVTENEKAYKAAFRELKEETGVLPTLFWAIPSVNQFYDIKTDSIFQIPAFAAEIDETAAISLNHEHVASTWISQKDINEYISWPEQRRLMNLLVNIASTNEILEQWII